MRKSNASSPAGDYAESFGVLEDILSLYPDGPRLLFNPQFARPLLHVVAFLPLGFSKDEAAFLLHKAEGEGIARYLRSSS